jgi:hypothetical protein
VEQAAQQRAIVESFESQKKLLDDVRAHEEGNDARWRRAVDLSLQQSSESGGGEATMQRNDVFLSCSGGRSSTRRTSNGGG